MSAPVVPLGGGQVLILLVQLSALLLLGLGLGRLAVRFGLPPIVGELLAGVLLGPSLLGHAAPALHGWLFPADPAQMHLLDAIGQLGVLLLVGMAGIELDTRLLRRRGMSAARISLAGLLIPVSLGILIGCLAPSSLIPDTTERPVFALFLAIAMCVTAIPVIAKTLVDMKLIHRDVGQMIMTAGMVDDSVAWLLLSVVSAMATVGIRAGRIVTSLLLLVGFVVAAVLAGRPLVRGAMRLARRSTEATPTIVTVVVIILTSSAITSALHMEAVFGAFIAGILVGHCAREQRKLLAPLRTVVLSVLAPIFLASAGLRMDLGVLLDPEVAVAAVVVLAAAISGKFAGAYLGARSSRLSRWEGVAIGAGMNARGVVEIVVAMVGLRLGVLDIATFTIIALVAIVTSLMAPPLLRLAMSRVEHTEEELLRMADNEAHWSPAPIAPQPQPPP